MLICGCSTILASLEKNSTWSWYMILLIYCWFCFIILLRILASYIHQEYSVQFSRSVMSDSLGPHESQHARPPCPTPTPGVHSNSTSIESVMPSSHLILCLPLLPPSIFPSISPSMNIQDWFPLWTGWISLQSKGLSRVFSNTTVQKHQFFIFGRWSCMDVRVGLWRRLSAEELMLI